MKPTTTTTTTTTTTLNQMMTRITNFSPQHPTSKGTIGPLNRPTQRQHPAETIQTEPMKTVIATTTKSAPSLFTTWWLPRTSRRASWTHYPLHWKHHPQTTLRKFRSTHETRLEILCHVQKDRTKWGKYHRQKGQARPSCQTFFEGIRTQLSSLGYKERSC